MAEEANQLQLTRVARLLRKKRLTCGQATELTELISTMASRNITARLESKFDVQAEELRSLNERYKTLTWVFGVAFAVLALIIAALPIIARLILGNPG